jgi:hypothetical protein
METPNDIDMAIVDAKVEGLSTMYYAAVHGYRQGLIDTMCRFAREFVPGVHAIQLMADVDWRWTFNGFVDADGQVIEVDFGQYDVDEMELFSSAFLSELHDFEAGTGYVYVADREFSHLDPHLYAFTKAAAAAAAKAE